MTSTTTPTKSVAVQTGEELNEFANMTPEELKEHCISMSTACSLVIGTIIGIFIQCSTLGSNFLMSTMYGQDVFLTQKFIGISLGWCLITSIMGVSVLLFLRSLVITSFYATNCGQEDRKELEDKENFMVKVIDTMEQFFAVGSLIGVGFAWTVTDLLLGMQTHIYHSLLTVAVAIVWCRVAMKYSGTAATQAEQRKELAEPLINKEPYIALV